MSFGERIDKSIPRIALIVGSPVLPTVKHEIDLFYKVMILDYFIFAQLIVWSVSNLMYGLTSH